MNYRILGKTGFRVSELSLGTWQVGGKWGETFDDRNADIILNKAIDSGINFIDTADVYNEGKSEQAIGRLLRSRKERIYVATKCGRMLNPHTNEAYQPGVLRKFIEQSLKRMQTETLDLIQLHCPPTQVYYRPEIFDLFETLRKEGKILNLGVSVEKVEEALKAIEYPNVTTIQIIFNMFRQRPAELLFSEAVKRGVGIIVRVPLASGLLTGMYSRSTTFGPGDHRKFNREGAAFDKGETFSGIDYETGLHAVEELKKVFPNHRHLSLPALRWILMFHEVSCVIPGVSNPVQLDANLSVMALPPLSGTEMREVKQLYEERIKPLVHHLW